MVVKCGHVFLKFGLNIIELKKNDEKDQNFKLSADP